MNVYEFILEWLARYGTNSEVADRLKQVQTQLGEIAMALQDVKAQLEANNAKIAEIAGDVAELKTSNDELVMKVDELKAQLPDNELVSEISQMVADQSEKLSAIAAVVPEAEQPTEPTA
jgi:chromosome segregation ATPase